MPNLCWHNKATQNFPLYIAIENKNLKVVAILLQAGADASWVNIKNKTPIECAAEAGQWNCVLLLESFGH